MLTLQMNPSPDRADLLTLIDDTASTCMTLSQPQVSQMYKFFLNVQASSDYIYINIVTSEGMSSSCGINQTPMNTCGSYNVFPVSVKTESDSTDSFAGEFTYCTFSGFQAGDQEACQFACRNQCGLYGRHCAGVLITLNSRFFDGTMSLCDIQVSDTKH